jgi:hypothetical protein
VIEVACGWRGLTVWLAQGENATQAGLCWQEQRRGERIGETTRRVATRDLVERTGHVVAVDAKPIVCEGHSRHSSSVGETWAARVWAAVQRIDEQTRAAFRASGKVEWMAPCVVGARMNFKNQGLGNCSFAPNVEIRHRAWHARSDSTPSIILTYG